jgi:hypothetical protein
VLARLGAVVSETADVLITNEVLALAVRHFLKLRKRAALDLGVKIVSVGILKLKKPSHMVDTRDLLLKGALSLDPKMLKKVTGFSYDRLWSKENAGLKSV